MKKLVLRTALRRTRETAPIFDRAVTSARVDFDFVPLEPITRAFPRMIRDLEFHLSEMALCTLAIARDYSRPIDALPVVLSGGYHHGSLRCPSGSFLREPAGLRDRTVGVRAWAQTTGVWVRGILSHEYDLPPQAMRWMTAEPSHVAEFSDPPFVQRSAPEITLPAMLHAGEIDALIVAPGAEDHALRTVIPDAAAEGEAWGRRLGIYPVNHILCIQRALLAEHPWLAQEIVELFAAARPADSRLAYAGESLQRSADLALTYTAEQGLTRQSYSFAGLCAAR